jgi:hypothetical protein
MTYNEFIQNILDVRGRFGIPVGEYKERHHIIPKCLGGLDNDSNLIDLYAREHYEAHRLLAIENPDSAGLIFAWHQMSHGGGSTKQRLVVSQDEYEEARVAWATFMKENWVGEGHPCYGRTDMSGENNPMYGVHRFGESSPHYGHHHTDTVKDVLSKYHSVPALQYSIDGEFIREWPNAKEAAKFYGLSPTTIKDARRGRTNTAAGYIWKYPDWYTEGRNMVSNNLAKREANRTPRKRGADNKLSKPVSQFDVNGNFIQEWASAVEAMRNLGINNANISKCCISGKGTAGGFIWKFSDKNMEKK